MAHQASMNGGLRFRKPEGVFGSLGELGGNIAGLVELQAKLAAIDLKDSVGKASVPTTTLIVSAIVLISTLPVLLIGLGFVLASALGISNGLALLITGGTVALIAAVVGSLATIRFLRSFESFRRSREELVRNVNWIRTVVVQSSKSTAK